MRWRTVLIDVPAIIITWWFRVYWLLLTAVTIISVTAAVLVLILGLFGVRWGW